MTKTVKLGEICRISKGKKHLEVECSENVQRYIQIEDLNHFNKPKFTLEKGVNVTGNDLIIAWDGANAGKVGVGLNGVIGSTLARLKIENEQVEAKYLFRYLDSKFDLIKSQRTGATIPHVNGNELRNLLIPLPALPEQRRIAALLDRADALRQKDSQLLAHYDALAQSVFLDMFGDPVQNEKGWKFSTLRSISNFITDGPFGSNLKTEHYRSNGIRVIRLTNVGIGTFLEKDEAFVSEEHYHKVLKKHTCLPGDLVIATLGEPNLRACIVPDYVEKAINKADVILCRPNPKIANSQYLNGLINHPSMLSLAGNLMHGQTRVRISMGQLATLEIPVPPLPLQQQFATVIEQIERQKAVVRRQMAESEALFGRLLQQSFGE